MLQRELKREQRRINKHVPPQAPRFFPNTMRNVGQANLEVSNCYQYLSGDIQTILNLRTAQLDNVYTLGSVTMSDADQEFGNNLENLLQSFFDNETYQAVLKATSKQHILIPILINDNHWIGIRLELQKDRTPKITYYNSINSTENNDEIKLQVMLAVKKQLARKSVPNPRMQDYANCMEQTDITSCGPYLIENMYCDITQTVRPASATRNLDIRKEHVALLRSENSNYLNGFLARQEENVGLAFQL